MLGHPESQAMLLARSAACLADTVFRHLIKWHQIKQYLQPCMPKLPLDLVIVLVCLLHCLPCRRCGPPPGPARAQRASRGRCVQNLHGMYTLQCTACNKRLLALLPPPPCDANHKNPIALQQSSVKVAVDMSCLRNWSVSSLQVSNNRPSHRG